MQDLPGNIIIIIIFTTLLMIVLVAFIVSIFFLYQKKQILYFNNIEQLKLEYENNLLSAQLEIQENTFKNISQEIHDNIGLSLTLAKLNLNSIEVKDQKKSQSLVLNSGELITKAINDLSDLSKSFNAEIIVSQGLISSLELEIGRIKKSLNYNIEYQIVGEPFFLDSKKEVLLFRIFQESINNILKHASANKILVQLCYSENQFTLAINDDGKGFNKEDVTSTKKGQAGIKNILRRASLMDATATIETKIDFGTLINIILPINPLQHDNN
jgi:two-component system NarL family sensor kinase